MVMSGDNEQITRKKESRIQKLHHSQ